MTVSTPRVLVLVAACLIGASVSTVAQASNYVGLDGTSLTVDNTVDDDVNPIGARLRLGQRVNEFFDLELQLGGGLDESTQGFDELRAAFAGLYLKGYLPLGRRSALFALAGASTVELTQTIGRGRFSDNRSGFSFGFGLETQLTRRLDLSADFMRYSLDDDEFSEVDAVNLGLKLYF